MRKYYYYILVFAILFLIGVDADAQCSMCRYVSESAGENGSGITRGLNNGILYILGIPYMLLLGIGFLLFKKRREIFSSDGD